LHCIQNDFQKVDELLANSGIVRHRGKIQATIKNAEVFLEIQKEHGSFDSFVRKIALDTAGQSLPIVSNPTSINSVPSKTAFSDALSAELKLRGMKFVGSTIVYAFLQACGFVDDHEASCWVKKS
jgi:DNA-3-methyladenine glycosylase I